MKNPVSISLCFFLLTMLNCEPSNEGPEHISFVTMLGRDTLAIEQFTMFPGKVVAEIILRAPKTTYQRQTLSFDESGNFLDFYSEKYDRTNFNTDSTPEEQSITLEGDSLLATFSRGSNIRTARVEANLSIIPFLDMIHWPYEVAIRRMIHTGVQSIDQDLLIGTLQVPAGEYTLFTIPAPEGGTLIINKQTGQNGRTYDEARDLGRVPMTISQNNPIVERFTIDAVELDTTAAALHLKWGEAIFEVPFGVQMMQ